MLNSVVSFSLKHAVAVIAIAAMLLVYSVNKLRTAQYDVFPEFAPPTVTVQTEAPGFTAEQVEKLITQPVESAISGANGVSSMQSSSIQGLSAIDIFFDPTSDVVKNRQIISELLAGVAASLPSGVSAPSMAPLTSTTNNVMGIGLTSDSLSLMDLRTIADWEIRPALRNIKGVSEVEPFGGLVRQIQIQVDPKKLIRYGLTFDDVMNAAAKANGIRGAGIIDTSKERLTLNTVSSGNDVAEIAKTPIIRGSAEALDLAITLADVADVKLGNDTPLSGASIMGRPGVLLMVTSQYGANTLDVTHNVEEALKTIKPLLAQKGINVWGDLIRPASFIEKSLSNLSSALYWGAGLVVVILLVFLYNWRAALISALAIPFSLAGAAAIMSGMGYTLNTMTLGGLAVAVGLVVDDAVIGIENMLRRLRESNSAKNSELRYKTLLSASLEVRVPIVFATLAIIIVAIPIVTLPDLSGRFFGPLGMAYILATVMSLIVAVTITPALSMFLLKEKNDSLPPLTMKLKLFYAKMLNRFSHHARLIYIFTSVIVILSIVALISFKDEFLPSLHEGHFIVHMEGEPGMSLEESIRVGNEVTAKLLGLRFIDKVVQQTGRTEGGIDIWGTNISEFNVSLKKDSSLKEQEAEDQINEALKDFPDISFEVETFLTERVKEVMSGYTRDAALNIYSFDIASLDESGAKVMEILKNINAVSDIEEPEQPGLPQVSIRLKQDELDKYGLSSVEILDTVHTAYQGSIATQIYDNYSSTNVTVILDEKYRNDIAQLGTLPIKTASGDYIKLSEVAEVSRTEGPFMILRDGGKRVHTITFNVKGANLSDTVKEITAKINDAKILGHDSYFTIDSLAEASANSRKELGMRSLVAAIIVFSLLSIITSDFRQLLMIIIAVPFSISGGVIAVFLTGGTLSLGGLVGFLTLFGIGLRNSVMLIAHYNHLIENEGHEWNWQTIVTGSSERLLPILMTAIVTGIGLLPLALKISQPGHEIEGPMAIVILGGLFSSTVLNLFVLPLVANSWIKRNINTEN